MDWNLWTLYFVTTLVLCVTPGPAVLFVVSRAIADGFRASVWATLGIEIINLLYFALTAIGLSAAIDALGDWYFAIKWIGAAYLGYLGLAALFGKSPMVTPGAVDRPRDHHRTFVQGVIVQVSNPKAFLFFGALLPQFIDADRPAGEQLAILSATGIVLELAVLFGYGIVASRARLFALRPRVALWLNRLAGSALLLAGLGLAMLRRA